jgi:hypothetical protein
MIGSPAVDDRRTDPCPVMASMLVGGGNDDEADAVSVAGGTK